MKIRNDPYGKSPDDACEEGQALDALLLMPAPTVSVAEAEYVANCCYPAFSHGCQRLAGERDANYRITDQTGRALLLKFINPAETLAETEMQIAALKHLAAGPTGTGITPRHQACNVPPDATERITPGDPKQEQTCAWTWFQPAAEKRPIRVRAYDFLEGRPGSQLAASKQGWIALGQCMADLDQALAGFDHPAMYRRLLWDTARAADLRGLVDHIQEARLIQPIRTFLDRFENHIAPELANLPHQVIHNDLSPSNILVDKTGLAITGVLDFGDIVYAPRIAEIAVGASYQMSRHPKPLRVLKSVVNGYESVIRLAPTEHEYILDLVLARLVQRIVIASWRAARFPANRQYIMRSTADAISLFSRLYFDG
jgi:Ser/Thr protein kinase RdoA (MazF antagonist)